MQRFGYFDVQGGSNMTGTDLCVNNINQSRSYLNHLVLSFVTMSVELDWSC